MQYEQTNEKVTMMDGPPVVVIRPLSVKEDPQIQRIRKCLLIIVGVFLAPWLFSIIVLILTHVSPPDGYDGNNSPWKWSSILVPVILYSFGIFVGCIYSARGLRVFAWLCIVVPILAGIGISIYLFLYMPRSALPRDTGNNKRSGFIIFGPTGFIIECIIFTAAFALTILKIVLAFKLARLIDAKTSLATQQI